MPRFTYKIDKLVRMPIEDGGRKFAEFRRIADAVSPEAKAPDKIIIDLTDSFGVYDSMFGEMIQNQALIRVWIEE